MLPEEPISTCIRSKIVNATCMLQNSHDMLHECRMADLVALEQETGLGNPGNSGNWEIFGNCEMCGNSGDVGKPNFPNYGKFS